MDLKLKGKRALVTGSSSGIGAAIAVALADEGVSVVVHGRDAGKANAIGRQVEGRGVGAAVTLGDLTSDEAALAAFGGIDILVNCAGGVVRGDNPKWRDVTPKEWLTCFDFNVVASIRMAQVLAPGMVERGWGRIINISSVGGGRFSGMHLEYGSAKCAIEHVTGNLSKALARDGVTVNVVIPGTVLTPQSERWILTLRQQNGWSEDFAENERIYTSQFSPQPVPRLGRPEEIAAAVAFLASPLSNYATGAALRVDGGSASAR